MAPKVRQSSSRSSHRESRSVASTSRKSAGGRSATSNARHRSIRNEGNTRRPIFLRGLDKSVCGEWFEDDSLSSPDGALCVWLDPDVLLSKALKGVTWASVSVVRPANLEEPADPQLQTPDVERPAARVVARLCSWTDAPDSNHAALSPMLCAALGSVGLVGGIVRIEAAPTQLPRTTSVLKHASRDQPKDVIVKSLRISPFITTTSPQSTGLRFGGESTAEREEAARRIKSLFGTSEDGTSLLDGPLTDGMILPAEAGADGSSGWPGGIVRFDPSPATTPDTTKKQTHWLIGAERKIGIEVLPGIVRPKELARISPEQELPQSPPTMVGIDPIIDQLQSNLLRGSSLLLTGGLGSGKTSLAHLLGHDLRTRHLFHTIYYPCRTLITDETRVSTIESTLRRLFGSASWGARLGGKSIVILDDLDKLCPAETELQVGNDNGRSRQVSELICSIVREHCSRDSRVVLLATAQGKESLNNVVVGGHVVRDIVALKAPNKDGRRKVLDMLVNQKAAANDGAPNGTRHAAHSSPAHAWMDGSDGERSPFITEEKGFTLDPSIDLLDIAGQTDGYMPGDLTLLVSRAHSEALIRSVSTDSPGAMDEIPSSISLSTEDFAAALKGFTPASLRNVTLQASTTTFSAIGGLRETRQTLLETLQYPTTYAPIFAQCPLRLRSGLLLYGYPGCGKTLLASAVAGECGLNFISVKGPEILNKYIGASEKSVRDLFERAEAARPCVLFFDEFDSIAPKRGHDSTGVTDRVVNQLLTQMDGAEGLSGVYVLAATSRPDLIDPALLRPGRLDKSLLCDMPDLEDRLDVLKAVSAKLKMSQSLMQSEGEENIAEIARQTQGYSGADLQAVMYNAHLEAIHDVLGPSDGMERDMGKSKNGTSPAASKHRDFTYFKLGDEDPPTANGTSISPAALSERAAIAAKLAAMELARKRARQQRYQDHQQADKSSLQQQLNGDNGEQEPVIYWNHVLKSLETTRPSISREEQRRLRGIYREFVVGRNGEMPDGQAGNEIGGRTSLM